MNMSTVLQPASAGFDPGVEGWAQLDIAPRRKAMPVGPSGADSQQQPAWQLPAPAQAVSQTEAAAAFDRVAAKLLPDAGLGTLDDLGSFSMQELIRMAAMVGMAAFTAGAQTKVDALKIMTDRQEELRESKLQDTLRQIDTATADAGKVQKTEIGFAVFDWIVSAVEIVVGIGKLFVGNIAGGVTDILAGSAGIVKAAAETSALIGGHNESLDKVIEVAGWIQLGFEMIGVVVDVTNAVFAYKAAKPVMAATENVIKGVAKEAVEAALKDGKVGIEALAKNIGKQVADQAAGPVEQAMKQLFKESTNATLKKLGKAGVAMGADKLVNAFAKEAIEEIVTKAVGKALQKLADKGGEVAIDALAALAAKELKSGLRWAAAHSLATVANTVRGLAKTLPQINGGIVELQRAGLEKILQELIANQQLIETIFSHLKNEKEGAVKTVSDQYGKLAESMKLVNQANQGNFSLASRIANSTI